MLHSIIRRTTLSEYYVEIKSERDLLPPGAEPGTIPTDLEQATGLERLEILGKMQGIDVFDMSPLPSDRTGTQIFPGKRWQFGIRIAGLGRLTVGDFLQEHSINQSSSNPLVMRFKLAAPDLLPILTS